MSRRVTALDVRCAVCGTPPGLSCWALDGSKPTMPHPQRRQLANAEDQRLNPEHVQGQLPLFPAAVAT